MKTIGEVLTDLNNLKTKEEARSYLNKSADKDTMWSNIKYITGYLGNEERNRILELFKGE